MIRRNTDSRRIVRCAVYTRVSTTMQAQGEFSSIDNQREAAEAYITSQAGGGWQLLPTKYDDAGWSGSTLSRPALRQLIADAEAGLVDQIVVYKIDRLSRSLFDFAQLIESLEKIGVGVVSVTQQFDTSSSMGKLTLNILLSFAQFEREMIAERTQDKVLAARRKGRWTGGIVPLGYDLVESKLVPNEAEATQVREMYRLYLEQRTLTGTLAEVHRRGWKSKSWTTKSGSVREGKEFGVDSLRRLLASPYYAGKISSGDAIVEALHEGIVEPAIWEETQLLLDKNATDGGRRTRNSSGALLKGILRCGQCGRPMTPARSGKRGVAYTYYVCASRRRGGAAACPHGKVSAPKIEATVIEQIKTACRDPEMIEATIAAAHAEHERQLEALQAETRLTEAEATRLAQEEGKMAAALGRGGHAADVAERRLAKLGDRAEALSVRLDDLRTRIAALESESVDEDQLRRTLVSFAAVWEVLEPVERCQLVRLLIAEAVYDGSSDELSLRLVSTQADEEGREADELAEASA